ncbi:carbonic anhydrase [Sinimarinibacterium sp. NLF-5-8]|uniref:carbonic anhydrase n=1 Tax=Sinimarinibacterium sp. NLF-5-8 TaxID=2698684 RepID=UPI00137C3566|nr:carbonic anhydrase [Sinimarinibacterium sp. NLF-5-8]QHS10819.1 carbonic anhydrase [Sinimarinibacterium sp. NLF-5-8]
MNRLNHLFSSNAAWAAKRIAENAEYFHDLSKDQKPGYLWIGCSDARVPANEILGLAPGDVFVHRNVANVVVQSDLNCLSVMQYAIDALQVPHIIVVGHYGCGGVGAALRGDRIGVADNWIRHVRDVADRYSQRLAAIKDEHQRYHCLCELNVVEQVLHVCQTTVVEDAWKRGQSLSVHGWIYGLDDGRLKNLGLTVIGAEDVLRHHAETCDKILTAYSAS